ncbi:heme peroxidase family protein [Solirubrobacter ginsenosidimutans]|uniref:Heme peroxidase family protein n=1 Tax=Solirubrobacter ginsenosidimutans TaxID=490573 RepID=A0A9X3MPT2_9ACTN|nr:heme peroxidase family protein [Solirubrobacter ginsenosidimutans]MDA0160167.1 heme peroxidase family protein [Solirubrobacter ginsenosidimutans]
MAENPTPEPASEIPRVVQEFLRDTAIPKGFVNPKPLRLDDLRRRVNEIDLLPTVAPEDLLESVNRIKPARIKVEKLPEEQKESLSTLKARLKRFHGTRIPLYWFPFPWVVSTCADRFGYRAPTAVRTATRLPFNVANQALLAKLGDMMGDAGRDPNPLSQNPGDPGVSSLPAGYVYFGQFVDHDITLDVSSTLDAATDANTVNNMRSPTLDLDSVYGRGPGLDAYLYAMPSSGPPTAIKLAVGTNRNLGPGGPSSTTDAGGMGLQTTFDVPRVAGTNTAVIGDPRNDENLIVVQFHHAMLRFHNAVVDLLLAASFAGDIFAEAKRIVTHHYQWAVVNDYLRRICGNAAVDDALNTVSAPIGSSFRMPVEFSVAAYRFGHSMIRDNYWVNFNFKAATLGQVFEFNRNPQLPVFSNWVVDFNAFFDTPASVLVPVHNKARRIDSVLSPGLESLPGFTGMMAILATRNLRRGLALGLPSGQGMAQLLGIPAMTTAQLTSGLPPAEVAVLNSGGGLLLAKTPLWYYVLREAAVLAGGNRLGPVGAKIVAETFVRILKRDASSYLNVAGGFAPMLPSATPGAFTVADLVTFAGVTTP